MANVAVGGSVDVRSMKGNFEKVIRMAIFIQTVAEIDT